MVSEERGTISIANDGRLRPVGRPRALAIELRRHARPRPRGAERGLAPAAFPRRAPRRRDRAGLWVVQVPGSVVTEVEVEAPVVVEKLPGEFRLETIEPEVVTVRLTGRRRDLVLARNGAVEVRVDALLVRLGRRTFPLTPELVDRPEGLEVTSIRPDRVKISIGSAGASAAPPADG